MNKKIIFSILCVLAVLFAFTGCKKDEAKTEAPAAEVKADEAKADEAKADEAKADEAKADEAKADEAKPAAAELDTKQALKTAVDFFTGLTKAGMDAGDDCSKMGKDMTEYLKNNSEPFVAAMKVISKVNPDDPAVAEYKDDMEKLDKIMGEDSDFTKAMDKCKDNEDVMAFSLGFLAIMMSAAEEKTADAPAADAAAPADDAAAPAEAPADVKAAE